jgi:hypothetical protein
MSVTCPNCGAEYDSTLFQFGHKVRCVCGHLVDGDAPRERPAGERAGIRAARREVDALRRRADAVTAMLMDSQVPMVDVEIARNELREWVRSEFPEGMELFEMVYEARWRRLAEQGWARRRRNP